ncbi:Leishmanolysin-like peptidase [Durusdinium trenchii]|uniref:Leishmanolysin-like peptidase n=1 Tax=Durusdinium trenchii TaxID=1381693 RepID=A0ABP0JWB8_9DINO
MFLWPCLMRGFLPLLVSLLLLARGQESRYLHFDRTRVTVSNQSARRLQDRIWHPIRIHLETSGLEEQITDPALRSYVEDDMLPAAARWLSSAVQVLPVLGNLRLKQHCDIVSTHSGQCMRVAADNRECGPVTIPVEHFQEQEYCPNGRIAGCQTSPGGTGIPDTDLIIYITALRTTWCSGNTVAYAAACRQAEDDRPVAGYLNFCPQRLGQNHWHQDVAVALHETLHSMAFSSSLFPFFRDASGAPRTSRDQFGFPPLSEAGFWVASDSTIKEELVDGQLRHFLVTPKVVQAARHHYACDRLTGIPMEEQGGDGTRFSHWDARIMHTEVMAAESSTVPRISDLTLALLEDSGWYKVHGGAASIDGDSVAGAFFFGKNKGCSFVEGQCIIAQQSAFPGTFCTENQGPCASQWSGSLTCSHDAMAVGLCSNCQHTNPLPVAYRHFENPRQVSVAQVGYCPVVEPFWFCKDQSAYSAHASFRYGESLGAASRCILSTATQEGYTQPQRALGSCRNVYCEDGGVKIQIGGPENLVHCAAAESGQPKQVYGQFRGYVLCPDYVQLCGAEGVHGPKRDQSDCLFPGVLRHGRCVCPPGSLGTDCRVRDVKAVRQDYPFGFRYPQLVFNLKVGVPVSQSELVSWPVRPTQLDGPSLVSYRVAPDLPYGLLLRDGVLEGTPLVPSARQTYVIECFGWTGGASTVIFISVACEGASCDATTPIRPTTPTTTSAGPRASTSAGTVLDERRPAVLVMALQVQFSALQRDPGLETFAQEMQVVFRRLLQVDLANVGISAAADGHAVVEAWVPRPLQQQLEEGLRQQLQDPASSLWSSSIGRYLDSASITSINEEGATQVWPPKEDAAPSWIDLTAWQDWLTSQPLWVKVAIIGALTVLFMAFLGHSRTAAAGAAGGRTSPARVSTAPTCRSTWTSPLAPQRRRRRRDGRPRRW